MPTNSMLLFLSVAGAHFLALLSPGADFILIVKNGLSKPWKRSAGIAVGISAANGTYIALCLLGAGSLISASPVLLKCIRISGGLYLAWLGICGLRSRRSAADITEDVPEARRCAINSGPFFLREFSSGFFASLLNPKLPLFYVSLFSAVPGQGASFTFRILLGLWMTSVVLAWDVLILRFLAKPAIREPFLCRVRLIDRVSGAVLLALGVGFLAFVR